METTSFAKKINTQRIITYVNRHIFQLWRCWLRSGCDGGLVEYLLHRNLGLGFVLPVLVLHLCATLVWMYPLVEHGQVYVQLWPRTYSVQMLQRYIHLWGIPAIQTVARSFWKHSGEIETWRHVYCNKSCTNLLNLMYLKNWRILVFYFAFQKSLG